MMSARYLVIAALACVVVVSAMAQSQRRSLPVFDSGEVEVVEIGGELYVQYHTHDAVNGTGRPVPVLRRVRVDVLCTLAAIARAECEE